MSKISRKHAIVIGGGMAGLLAGRILSNHFEAVTIIERDHYPADPVFRSGVPQGRQVHAILLQGQRTLETLFPGLKKRLLAQGAIKRDYGNESLYYYGGRCPKIPPVLHGWNCSRLLLEWQIRQELAAYDRVHILEGHEVVHLLYEEESGFVCGVQFRERNHLRPTENKIQDMSGDLVIDASGASSHTPRWLKELGYDAPSETVVNPDLGYATRYYEPPTQNRTSWKGIAIQGTQQNQRGGTLMEIEGGRWMVVLAGAGKQTPPTDPEGFLEFARNLPDPALYEAIKEAAPLSPIYGYRRTENRLRHYEKLTRQPEGLLVLGDAVCTFNPLYGQGMTITALEAQMLDRCLHSWKGKRSFACTFQQKLAKVLAFPWQLATAADARSSVEEAAKARGVSRWFRQYVEGVILLLPRDQKVLLTFLEVMHMLRSPLALLRPTIIAKVVSHRRLQQSVSR